MVETLSWNGDALCKYIVCGIFKKDKWIQKFKLSNFYCFVINIGVQISAQEIIIIVIIIRIQIIIWLSYIHKDKCQ